MYAWGEKEIDEIVRRVTREIGISQILPYDIVGDVDPEIAVKNSFAKCEIAVAVLGKKESTAVGYEIRLAERLQKPLVLFVDKERVAQDWFVAGFVSDPRLRPRWVYATYTELEESLRTVLALLRTIFPSEYLKARRQQDQITQQLETSMESNVLVLGKDSNKQGVAKMERIEKVLRMKGYSPVTLKDIPDIKYISLENKMIRVASLCRFVIAEDSRPSGHIDEIRLCANCEFITGVVRRAGTGSTWMQAHYPVLYTFFKRFCYEGRSHVTDALCKVVDKTLENAVEKAIDWANLRIEEQRKLLEPLYSKFP